MEHMNGIRPAHMKFSHGISFLAVIATMVFLIATAVVPAQAQGTRTQQSEQILQPSGETAEHDSFGSAVAISGNTMVIGAFNADGNEVGAGAAYIFDKIGNTWVQTAKLFAADGHARPANPLFPGDFISDSFGLTVAISQDGNTVIVGAPSHNHATQLSGGDIGAVYVFQRTNGAWSQEAELLPPHPNVQDHFGDASDFGGLAISGNTIVVTDQGTALTGSLPGSVDVFTRANGTWTLTTQLLVPDDPFFFPSSVAFDGHTLAVGSDISDAPNAFEGGAVYVFQFSEGQWSGPVTLGAADATSGALFGFSVSLNGGLIAVGASAGPGTTSQSGAAYVFAGEGGVWSQKAKLIASDGLDFDNFGVSIGVSGQTVFVGATGHTPAATGTFSAGSAYVYRQGDGGWRQVAQVSGSDGISGGQYGLAVAIRNNTLLVGADLQHPLVEGYPGGEAYVYSLNP